MCIVGWIDMIVASAAEAWQSVPVISLHLPVVEAVFSLDIWAVTAMHHCLNHSNARAKE
jgi:ABC-type microcin C transport system permease subunit YejE